MSNTIEELEKSWSEHDMREYIRVRNEIEQQFEALAEIQKEHSELTYAHENDSWFVYGPRLKVKFIGYAITIAMIVSYANDNIVLSAVLILVFLKYLEFLISTGLEGVKQNISSSLRETHSKLRRSSEIIYKIRGELDDLFQMQQDNNAIVDMHLDTLASDIELNTYRIEKLKNRASSSETSNEVVNEINNVSNSDIDEQMIEYKNWDLDTTFLLLKKISNEEFEAPLPEIVLKRISHMCGRTEKNELDQDDIKNVKDFTGGKDVINKILKALNIELFIKSINEELEQVTSTIPDGPGTAQFKWIAQKQYLKEKYNIDWLSPQDLQPNLEFF